nr:MAG TPA: hypothetical protein [Caudoviricetes sp.]
MPRKGRPQRVTGTFPEALKQGRTAMPYQPHKRARKREKLSAHKLVATAADS